MMPISGTSVLPQKFYCNPLVISFELRLGLGTPLEGVRASNPFSSFAGGWRWRGDFSASLGFSKPG